MFWLQTLPGPPWSRSKIAWHQWWLRSACALRLVTWRTHPWLQTICLRHIGTRTTTPIVASPWRGGGGGTSPSSELQEHLWTPSYMVNGQEIATSFLGQFLSITDVLQATVAEHQDWILDVNREMRNWTDCIYSSMSMESSVDETHNEILQVLKEKMRCKVQLEALSGSRRWTACSARWRHTLSRCMNRFPHGLRDLANSPTSVGDTNPGGDTEPPGPSRASREGLGTVISEHSHPEWVKCLDGPSQGYVSDWALFPSVMKFVLCLPLTMSKITEPLADHEQLPHKVTDLKILDELSVTVLEGLWMSFAGRETTWMM